VPRPPQNFTSRPTTTRARSWKLLACTARYTHIMPFPARQMFSVAPRAPSMATLAVLESALSGLRISTPAATGSQVWRRHASHQAQGRANKAADGAGKRLGAKKSGGEYVVPGNILFKQRGTLWFPGDNCSMVCSGKTT
jgi:ribosomal protein L27